MRVHRDPQTLICYANQISHKILAITLITVVIFGCKNESGLVETLDPPQVSLTSPAADEENVALTSTISATFNRQMDPSSINDTTFTVLRDTIAIAGEFSYRDSTSTFTPTANLTANSTIRVRISANVLDMDGNAMDQDFEWSFTTEDETETEPKTETDDTPPQITETNPSPDAQNIPMNSAVTATFSEEIDPSTVNTATFLLENGTTVVTGSVSYSGMTAVFTPSENLERGTVYLATITSGVQDTAGNALAEDYTWNFNTENSEDEETDTVPPTINATNPDDTDDNVAIDITLSATFSEPMNASTISATTFTLSDGENPVNGVVEYSENNATFNPDEDLENGTTYTATVTTGVQDTAGNAMSENYTWSFTTEAAEEDENDTTPPTVNDTDPEDDANNVPVNSAVSATFSEPINASTLTTNTFTLSTDGDLVPGSVKYSNNSATFNPDEDLENGTTYTATVTTGVQDTAGNAMTENYTWNFTTEEAEDNEAPIIDSTSPDNNDDNVSINTILNVEFSEEMDASTITTTTFTLSDGENSVNGKVEYSGNSATFDPDGDLENGTTYTATITTGAQDLAGNPLAAEYQWEFTTEEEPDNEAPSVTSTAPADNQENVSVNISVQATFSEPMNASTISNSTFILSSGDDNSISGSVSYSGNTATFDPDGDLENGTTYTATIKTGAEDQAGNSISEDYEWRFTTAQPEDNEPPEITETFPKNKDNNVETDITITASFSEALDPATINENTFVVRRQFLGLFVRVAGTVNFSGTTASFTPDDPLLNDRDYFVTITVGVTDLAGNSLEKDYEWKFETKRNDDDDD